jgi:hypothetical protein
VRSSPSHFTPRGGPNGLPRAVKEARERAHRHQWRNGGTAQRRLGTSDQEMARGEVHEHRGSKANAMCAQRKEKGERRVGVHGAVFSSEFGRDSGEQFHRRGSLPRETEASACYARERRRGWR